MKDFKSLKLWEQEFILTKAKQEPIRRPFILGLVVAELRGKGLNDTEIIVWLENRGIELNETLDPS